MPAITLTPTSLTPLPIVFPLPSHLWDTQIRIEGCAQQCEPDLASTTYAEELAP